MNTSDSGPLGFVPRLQVPGLEPTEAQAPRRRRSKAIEIKEGSFTVRIYPGETRFTSKGKRRKYKTHLIIWRDAAGRHRERRATLEEAKKRAGDIARNLVNGDTAMNGFSQDARASHMRCLELSAKLGQSPELIISKYVDLVKSLPEGIAPEEAIKWFLRNRPKGFVPCSVTELVEVFLAEKQAQKISADYYNHLSKQLEQFADHFGGSDPKTAPPFHLLTSADLNAWLRHLKSKKGQPLGSRARHNYRAAVDSLARWAQANGYLPATWNEMQRVADPGTKLSDIKIWTPDQFLALLHTRQHSETAGRAREKSLIPFLVCQAFAGIRHEELAPTDPKKEPLDWRNVHLKQKFIYIPPQTSKTGQPRTVPIAPNLAAWLSPYVQQTGRLCDLENPSNAITRAKKTAKLPSGRNESRNVLRKSFITYRLSIVQHIGQVAREAGNSPSIIQSNYLRVIPPGHVDGAAADAETWPMEPEARRWFGIVPQNADVLPLFSWGKAK